MIVWKEQISEPKLKMEISSLISFETARKGRAFSKGVFIKQLLEIIWQRLNYNIKFIESLILSDKTVAHRTLQLGTSIESQIGEKLINCEIAYITNSFLWL